MQPQALQKIKDSKSEKKNKFSLRRRMRGMRTVGLLD